MPNEFDLSVPPRIDPTTYPFASGMCLTHKGAQVFWHHPFVPKRRLSKTHKWKYKHALTREENLRGATIMQIRFLTAHVMRIHASRLEVAMPISNVVLSILTARIERNVVRKANQLEIEALFEHFGIPPDISDADLFKIDLESLDRKH
jgi:hypothetical protein